MAKVNNTPKEIKILIIDTSKDIKNLYREYPYPMRVIEETADKIVFENQGQIEEIQKKKYNYKILTK